MFAPKCQDILNNVLHHLDKSMFEKLHTEIKMTSQNKFIGYFPRGYKLESRHAFEPFRVPCIILLESSHR